MPEVTVALFAEAPTLAPEVALRRFVENALGAEPPTELVDELVRVRRVANPPDPAGWQAQAAAGTTFARRRSARSRAPTLVLHGTADNVVDQRNAQLLADRDPRRARRALRTAPATCFFWEQPDAFVAIVEEFLVDERAHDRPLASRHGRGSRRSASRSTRPGATWTYAELDARSDALAATARARLSAATASRR